MKFQKEKIKELHLLDTKVENIFISEYLPVASGDFVKVYLYALMYAEHEMPLTKSLISRELKLDVKVVTEAIAFWEEKGLIRRHPSKDEEKEGTTIFINQKDKLYGFKKNDKEVDLTDNELLQLEDKEIKGLFILAEDSLGRPISPKEMEDIKDSIVTYRISPDILSYSFKYCVEQDKLNLNYIIKVAKSWNEKDCNDVLQVKELLNKESKDRYRYKRVFSQLGFNRTPSPADIVIMDKWFNELGYTLERILEACDKTGGIRNPNLNYVNKVLENWKITANDKGVSINLKESDTVSDDGLKSYLKYIKSREKKEQEQRLRGIYSEIPKVEELDEKKKSIEQEFPRTVLMGAKGKTKREELKSEISEIDLERADIIKNYGYPGNYTDIKYLCVECNDTGISKNGGKCSCIGTRREEAKAWIQKMKKPL
ncbi:MAG: DnaD domain protein [Peptostreptococcaceae bacterium]|nr:DnaD domain protein [Peptostreptococcaceae bacterium]